MPHVYAGRRSLRLRLRPALPIGFVKRQRRATLGGVISLG